MRGKVINLVPYSFNYFIFSLPCALRLSRILYIVIFRETFTHKWQNDNAAESSKNTYQTCRLPDIRLCNLFQLFTFKTTTRTADLDRLFVTYVISQRIFDDHKLAPLNGSETHSKVLLVCPWSLETIKNKVFCRSCSISKTSEQKQWCQIFITYDLRQLFISNT